MVFFWDGLLFFLDFKGIKNYNELKIYCFRRMIVVDEIKDYEWRMGWKDGFLIIVY